MKDLTIARLMAPPQEVFRRLSKAYPFDPYGLGNPARVLLSCILSARTKDEITYPTADRLFAQYPTLEQLCAARPQDVESLLRPVGFYKVKAQHVREAACHLLRFGVPKTTEQLIEVPGIGPKCAAIVRAFGWGLPDIAVDTHVHRISKRLGWTDHGDDPLDTQQKLKLLFPVHQWQPLNHLIVSLGRDTCKPQKPACAPCVLNQVCPYPNKP